MNREQFLKVIEVAYNKYGLARPVKKAESIVDYSSEVAATCKTYSELLAYEAPQEVWLVENQLPRGVVAVVAGRSDAFKSWTCLYSAVCLAAGRNVFDDRVIDPARVVYVDEENGVGGIARRVKMIARGLGLEASDLPLMSISGSGVKLDDNGMRNNRTREVLDRIEEFKPDVIFIDCLQRVLQLDVDRENYLISQLFTDILRPLQNKFGCSVVLIHHLRKASKNEPGDILDQLRGGSELRNYARVIILLETPTTKRTGDSVVVNLSIQKLSDHERPPAKSILWTFGEGVVSVQNLGEPEKVLSREALVAEKIKAWVVREGKLKFKRSELKALDLGAGKSNIGGALNYLVLTEQYLVREGSGWYVVKPQNILEDFKEIEEPYPGGLPPKRTNPSQILIEFLPINREPIGRDEWKALCLGAGVIEDEFEVISKELRDRGVIYFPRANMVARTGQGVI